VVTGFLLGFTLHGLAPRLDGAAGAPVAAAAAGALVALRHRLAARPRRSLCVGVAVVVAGNAALVLARAASGAVTAVVRGLGGAPTALPGRWLGLAALVLVGAAALLLLWASPWITEAHRAGFAADIGLTVGALAVPLAGHVPELPTWVLGL